MSSTEKSLSDTLIKVKRCLGKDKFRQKQLQMNRLVKDTCLLGIFYSKRQKL